MPLSLRTAARLCLALLVVNCTLLTETKAQAPKTYTSSDILLGLKKLNVLGSVMYIAAHPDDENTRLIAYFANGRLLETSYLSCTRGDGGQDLIGPELREQLGVIRTQELLAARRIDGGHQFFTRANDFGFSKTSAETFTIWDKEQVLADMVWVIRQRRPDVLITRFPPDPRAGHGHHQASAILAAEAFDAAGDPKRFPEQLKYVQAWQPKRLLWNTGSFFVKPGENMSGYLGLDAGGYNPLLGQSYGEIAARSRSSHRSQGFGSAATRGEALEYFQPVKGAPAAKDLFDGVDQTWNRVPGGAAIGKMIDEVIRKYNPSNPSASVAGLLKVRELLQRMAMPKAPADERVRYFPAQSFWAVEKLNEIQKLIVASLGLNFEAIASEATATPGKTIAVKFEGLSRSLIPVELDGISYDIPADSTIKKPGESQLALCLTTRRSVKIGKTLLPNTSFIQTVDVFVPSNESVSQPYWLRKTGSIGMYAIPDIVKPACTSGGDAWSANYDGGINRQQIIGQPENYSVTEIAINLRVAGTQIGYRIPVQYKHTDPTLGELYQPLVVVPPVMVNIPAARAYVFADQQPKTVPVTLRAGRAGVRGALALQVPTGWQVEPATAAFDLKNKEDEQTVNFTLRPGPGAPEGKAEVRAVATVDGQAYTRGIQTIDYPHIPTQTLFPEAVAPLVKLNVQRRGQNVGYLMGAGDEVPEALRQLGYTVTLLNPATDLTAEHLARYDAVVLGVRAYNVLDRLKTQQPQLLKYVENGGNLVVQYVVNRGTVLPQIGPYPLTLSNDRVTVEGAPVTFLQPKSPLLNVPNKITAKDFEGWVQEQGLYYPSAWDAHYTPIIASSDPGETPKQSAILVADYGKGHYIYTGLSLFRELPAGVPGAYRILTNMVSLGK
ncbi:PIG-L family deacetylase [Hymenobacter coccineus]|uniref:LmbE family protein n=1 Tax=Hymenobacter coccineus TaxID=1908235 RepID=A0A1G1SZ92_9BACT|nr:PIG-L family deacetylase [Hymenobacter coccineus]OGX83954.1 LmbE family protein [Hymenobacter coccineus]